MEEPQFSGRSSDRPERAEVDGAVDRGGGDRGRLPSAHPASTGRLPSQATIAHLTRVAASLSTASRHLPIAGGGGRQPTRDRFAVPKTLNQNYDRELSERPGPVPWNQRTGGQLTCRKQIIEITALLFSAASNRFE
jgi:hypothetical protein